jgi:hypothetical protein
MKMVEINLIKQRFVLPIQRRERLLFFLGMCIPVLLFSFVIFAVIHSVNKTVIRNYSKQLDKQEEAREEELKRSLSPTGEEKNWQEKLKRVSAFQEQRFLVTPRLVVLADIIPSRLYLTSIAFDENTLLLEGQGLPGNQTVASLTAFLEKLNRNENFIQGMNEFRLDEIREAEGFYTFRISGTKK